mgnify:CR=1 FL=1
MSPKIVKLIFRGFITYRLFLFILTYQSIKSFLVAYFVTLPGNERYKLTGNLRAVAERDERYVACEEQSGWHIRNADIPTRISGFGVWTGVNTGNARGGELYCVSHAGDNRNEHAFQLGIRGYFRSLGYSRYFCYPARYSR